MSLLRYFPCCSGEEHELPSAKCSRIDDDISDCASSDIEGDIGADSLDQDESNFTQDRETSTESSDVHTTSSDMDSTQSLTSSTCTKPKQASTFLNDWLPGKEHWLKYIKGKGVFCTLCQKHKCPFARGTWNITPCTRIRLQSIISHERSAAHKDRIKLEHERTTSKTIASAINPVLPARGIEQAFLSLYFLSKQRILHATNYEPLLDLLGLLGVDVKTKIQIAKNAMYTSDKAIQEMLFVISEVIETRILNEMKSFRIDAR